MKISRPACLLAALLPLASLHAEDTNPPPQASGHLSVQVDIKPSSEKAGMYVATSEVMDLDNNRVLTRPKMLFSTKSPASIETELDSDDKVQIDISVNRDKQTADYHFRYLRAGKLMARQQLKLRLKA